MNERQSREAMYYPKRKQSRALEVSVIAMAGMIIVLVALSLWVR